MKKSNIEVEGGECLNVKKAGIYFIESLLDDRIYIGSSQEIRAISNNYPKKSNNRKLTAIQVKEIRDLLKEKVKGYIIANMFNVDPTTISNIKK